MQIIAWHFRTFDQLSLQELYEILARRQDIFIIEQHCDEPDLDYRDQEAIHLLGMQDSQLVTYLRLFEKGTLYPDAASFGRVLTIPSARNSGIARAAVRLTISYLEKIDKTASIRISAQTHLQNFYESFGFQKIGEPYDEAGILHIKMQRTAHDRS